MKYKLKLSLLALTCAVTFSPLVAKAGAPATSADHKGSNAATGKGKSSEKSDAVANAALAHGLVRYGDANKDPLALITAARLLQGTGASASRATREGTASSETKSKVDKFAVDAILERARALSAGHPDLLALAEDVAKSHSRGNTEGPSRHRDLVRTRATDVYNITFEGGQRATVAVNGDGDSDLDLYVYDENNNLVCKDDDATDTMICNWSPRWTGQFKVKIVNRGVANQYIILTN